MVSEFRPSASPAFQVLTQGRGPTLWVNLSGLRLEVTLANRPSHDTERYQFGAYDLAEKLGASPLFGDERDRQLLASLARKGFDKVPVEFRLILPPDGEHAGKHVVTITVESLPDFTDVMVVPISLP